MAIYQYHVVVVPRKAILARWHSVPQQIKKDEIFESEDDELTDYKWFAESQIEYTTLENRILKFAERAEWTKRSKYYGSYGDDKTNDISIAKDEYGYLTEFSFRLDLTELDTSFIDNLIAILNELNCLLIDRQGNVFEPNLVDMLNNIKKSNAFKFVSDPHDFFAKFSSGEIKPE